MYETTADCCGEAIPVWRVARRKTLEDRVQAGADTTPAILATMQDLATKVDAIRTPQYGDYATETAQAREWLTRRVRNRETTQGAQMLIDAIDQCPRGVHVIGSDSTLRHLWANLYRDLPEIDGWFYIHKRVVSYRPGYEPPSR